ncbi:MAG TPA: HD domain-containing phosphohydrolase [Tepidisphaeraceae bacterium]|jgi:putative nucleotidyltransferase with HDIG domain
MRLVPAADHQAGESQSLRLSDVVASLSYALDLTSGQPPGHASRSCLIGMRIAQELQFTTEDRSALFYGLLLKDLGCSTNASKMAFLFGADDQATKMASKSVDLSCLLPRLNFVAKNVAPGGTMLDKVHQFLRLALAGSGGTRSLIEMRCERGAEIARDLLLPEDTATAIRSLDEHYDGTGHPEGLKGDDIPLLARILGLAQTFEVFAISQDVDAAFDMAAARRGTWFDPQLVDALQSFRGDDAFWTTFFSESPETAAVGLEPQDQTVDLDEDRLDRIASGFARVVDAKSPWTYQHSTGVSTIAAGLAGVLGMPADQVRMIRRAGLLHDLGKLGVSNRILDKPGKLDADEITAMRRHTEFTQTLLGRVSAFRPLATLAASHHERLDGKGYHVGRGAGDLTTAARILGVADMYEALTAKRPYRQDLGEAEVMAILSRNVLSGGICPEVFAALQTYVTQGRSTPAGIAA